MSSSFESIEKRVILKEQLPKPTLNTYEIINQLVDKKPVKLLINGAEVRNIKSKTANVIVSFTILSDMYQTRLFDLNSNGDVICHSDIELHDSNIKYGNAKGLTFNYQFDVGMDQEAIMVDNTMEFYDIINHVFQKQRLVPKGNDKAIGLLYYNLTNVMKDNEILIKVVYIKKGKGTIKELKVVGCNQ